MPDEDNKPPGMTGIVISRMRSLREGKGWSARQLGDEMTKAGVPWDRSIVNNLEIGRRKNVTVEELFALAFVLEVSPLYLLDLEDGASTPYPVTPRHQIAKREVRHWVRFAGEDGSELKVFANPAEHLDAAKLLGYATGVVPAWLTRDLEEAIQNYLAIYPLQAGEESLVLEVWFTKGRLRYYQFRVPGRGATEPFGRDGQFRDIGEDHGEG